MKKIAHRKVVAPSLFVPTIEEWTAPSDEEIKRRRKFSVVVYAPKYDNILREEAEIEVTEDGKFKVEITKVGKNTRLSEDLGTFDSYEEAKGVLFEKFFDFFNKPSEHAIKSGANPDWKVWDEDKFGNLRSQGSNAQLMKRSVSIIEGDEAKTILGARVEEYKPRKMTGLVRIPDVGMPTVISVRTLYPSYFKHVAEVHARRKARLKRMRTRRK